MINVFAKSSKRSLRLFRGTLRRRFPFFAGRIAAAREIHPIPEFAMHPFARMIENADQSAPVLLGQPFGNLRDFLLRRFNGGRIVQLHPRVVCAQVIHVECAGVPKRFLIEADMRAFVHVTRHSRWRDANLL